jgi:hypothetical protein
MTFPPLTLSAIFRQIERRRDAFLERPLIYIGEPDLRRE